MRSRGVLAVAALLLPLGLLSACSGDDDSDSPDEAVATVEQREECQAEVELTGDVKASWSGEAFVVTENRSGPVLYKTTDGSTTLTLLAAAEDFPAVASLTTKKDTFSGSEGDFEVAEDGSGAEVTATLASGSGKSAELVASITC